jgi:hypothetical protein
VKHQVIASMQSLFFFFFLHVCQEEEGGGFELVTSTSLSVVPAY